MRRRSTHLLGRASVSGLVLATRPAPYVRLRFAERRVRRGKAGRWRSKAAGSDLIQVVALLAAGVVAVPIFKRLGLGSVLGYLAAGLVIGPFGLGVFSDPDAILHVAELGVVMFLFIIGLEMQPSRLWGLRREIFGLGVAAGRRLRAAADRRRHRRRLSRRRRPSSPARASC